VGRAGKASRGTVTLEQRSNSHQSGGGSSRSPSRSTLAFDTLSLDERAGGGDGVPPSTAVAATYFKSSGSGGLGANDQRDTAPSSSSTGRSSSDHPATPTRTSSSSSFHAAGHGIAAGSAKPAPLTRPARPALLATLKSSHSASEFLSGASSPKSATPLSASSHSPRTLLSLSGVATTATRPAALTKRRSSFAFFGSSGGSGGGKKDSASVKLKEVPPVGAAGAADLGSEQEPLEL